MLDSFRPPAFWKEEINQRADVFSLALTLWYLATRSHACSARPDQLDDSDMGSRELWPGRPELGALLARALVASTNDRISIKELSAGLRSMS